MKIKRFVQGQTVYVLKMNAGRVDNPIIIEHKVKKVGRKYVTIDTDDRFCEEERFEFGLVETKDWGERSYLCQSRKDATDYIEKRELETWLREVKRILG